MRAVRIVLGCFIVAAVACSAAGDSQNKGGSGGSGAATGGGAGSDAGIGGAGATGGAAGAGTGGSGATGVGGSAGAGAAAGSTGSTEFCMNGQDDDGNGLVDEGCTCDPDTTQDCWSGPAERRNVGACTDGKQACQLYGEFYSWGPCVGETLPSAEIDGNGIDEDCTGETCTPTSQTEICDNGREDNCDGLQDCQDPACASVCNCSPEVCDNGGDDDCDGKPDCADSDCVSFPGCKPVGGCTPQFPFVLEILCGDNADNDCDGKIDCDDPDCITPGKCGCPSVETNCSDGQDNDCDKDVDCADLDCQNCTPGTSRWCDDPQYCHWGKQQCGSDGKWGDCIEVNDGPGGCGGTLYNADCCVQAGECCQNYPTDDASIGNCDGIVECG